MNRIEVVVTLNYKKLISNIQFNDLLLDTTSEVKTEDKKPWQVSIVSIYLGRSSHMNIT